MDKKELIDYLKNQGFSEKITKAFEKVPRENFVPKELSSRAYENCPLPIGHGVTISQPFTIAFMLELLELKQGDKVLEIGSGCGYVLALINKITNSKTYGVERIKDLVKNSKKLLSKNPDIKISHKDGSRGLREFSPYDKILVSAAFEEIPLHLLKQLKKDGVLVTPVKSSIFKITNSKRPEIKEYPGFAFVPVIED